MDVNITSLTSITGLLKPPVTSTQQALPQAPYALKSQAVPEGPGNASVSTYNDNEAAIRKAALSFKNTYAVSDHSFTIFKDADGKYITRYISLRDGSITYVPQLALLRRSPPETGNDIISILA